MERERVRAGEGTNTLLSPLFSATHKKMSFWLYTKEPFYPPPPLSFSCLPFSAVFSFFSLTSLFPSFSPYNFSFFFAFLSLKERYYSANDLIRGAIWNSITVDFVVMTAVWREGWADEGRDVWVQSKFLLFNSNNNLTHRCHTKCKCTKLNIRKTKLGKHEQWSLPAPVYSLYHKQGRSQDFRNTKVMSQRTPKRKSLIYLMIRFFAFQLYFCAFLYWNSEVILRKLSEN